MNVYFINPKSGCQDFSYELPLNICQLISCIKDLEYIEKIEVFDFELNGYDKELIKSVNDSKNVIFCIPIYTYYFQETIQLCKIIKSLKKEVKIIVGGPHATLDGCNIIKEYIEIDYVLEGEGDYSLPQLLNSIKNDASFEEIRGLIYRDSSGSILHTKPFERIDDLKVLPLQTKGFEYFDLQKIKKQIGFLPYITSRGCCYQCIFCSSSNIWKNKLKIIPIEIVLEELKYIKSLGFDYVNFRDDFFTANKKWLNELMKGIKDIGLVWGCETRIDSVNDELLYKMQDSGCKLLRFGIETFNQKSLDLIGKKVKSELAIANLKKIIRMGFEELRCSFMVGIPGETVEDVEYTASICRELKQMKSRFWSFSPVIGTDVYNNMDKYGIRFLKHTFNSTYSNIETDHMSNSEINKLLQSIYDEFKHPLTYYHRDFSDVMSADA